MGDLICRKSMMRCLTPGMCSPHSGCQTSILEDCDVRYAGDSGSTAVNQFGPLAGTISAEDYRRCMAERDLLKAENERLRMQLVACGVVAMANTQESAVKARDMHPDYMSASCQDVMRAVDSEMALRAELERVRADAELLRKHLAECSDSLESEILDRFGSSKDHPAMRRKFECDMQDVIEARAAMGKGGKADG